MLCRAALIALVVCANVTCGWSEETRPMQHSWEVDPKLTEDDIWDNWERRFGGERVIDFDVADLKSASAEQRLHAARLICSEHDNRKFTQRDEAIAMLLEQLLTGKEKIQLHRAMISAAVLLCNASHAPKLWEASNEDSICRRQVERALIRWRSDVAVDVWRARCDEPSAPAGELALAIEGLAVVGGSEDRARLDRILRHSSTTLANRLLATKAMGDLISDGLNDLAQEVLDSNLEQRHLLAANLIAKHRGARTLPQCNAIMASDSSSAQRIAYRTIIDNFPSRAREIVASMSKHSDNLLRMMSLEVLRDVTDEPSLRIQGELMKDRNPEVCKLATQLVFEKSATQRSIVDDLITENLDCQVWQGVEQAILLATQLKDHSRLPKFLRLLDHPSPDVSIHAGWALMELANEPEILAGILAHAQVLTGVAEQTGLVVDYDEMRLSFLLESLGKNLYEPATSMLLKYVPKNFKFGIVSRASAVWSLGKLNKAKDNPKLRADLESRVAETSGLPPEHDLIRYTSMLAIGEMAHADCLDTAEKFNVDLPAPMGYACQWAIKQIKAASSRQAAIHANGKHGIQVGR